MVFKSNCLYPRGAGTECVLGLGTKTRSACIAPALDSGRSVVLQLLGLLRLFPARRYDPKSRPVLLLEKPVRPVSTFLTKRRPLVCKYLFQLTFLPHGLIVSGNSRSRRCIGCG